MQNDFVDANGAVIPCGSYLWGALLRIDVFQAPEDVRFVFFSTGVMQVYACRLLAADDLLELADPSGAAPQAASRQLCQSHVSQ
jgi:hypothetical protein